MSKIYQFYQLSYTLTGLSRTQLSARKYQTLHFKTLSHHVKAETIDELFHFHEQLKHAALRDLTLVRRQIISSAKFGHIALNIIRLWQAKHWIADSYALPASDVHNLHCDSNQSSNNLEALSTSRYSPAYDRRMLR